MAALAAFLALGTIANGTLVFTELAGAGGYARQAVSIAPAGNGAMVNQADIAFPAITGAQWPRYDAFALFDAATGGNLLMCWHVSSSEANNLQVGKRVRVPRGGIQLSFPVITSNHGSEVIVSGPYALSPSGLFLTPEIRSMTQAAYDALALKDADTLYLVRGA